MDSNSFSHLLADPKTRQLVSAALDLLDKFVANAPQHYEIVGEHFSIDFLGVGFRNVTEAREVLGVPRKPELCFSCDRFPIKYATGLCDACNLITEHAEDPTATVDTIKALTSLLFG